MANKKRFRSAVTGKFVSAAYAKRFPHLTVGESNKPKKEKSKHRFVKKVTRRRDRDKSPMVRG